MNPELQLVVKTDQIGPIWLSYVQGLDKRHFCAPGVVCERSRAICSGAPRPGTVIRVTLDEAVAPHLYLLCAVTGRREDDVHLACKPAEGDRAMIETPDLIAKIRHARRIPIPASVPPLGPGAQVRL